MPQRTIAIVDDEISFLEMMQDILTDEGYRTILRHTTCGISEMLQCERPALLILDIRIEQPESGWWMLTNLRHDPAIANLPIIICSADHKFLATHVTQLHELGCAVVPKPFGIDDMLASITTLLSSRQCPHSADVNRCREQRRHA